MNTITAEDLIQNPTKAEWQPWDALPSYLRHAAAQHNAGRCLRIGETMWIKAELVGDGFGLGDVVYSVHDENNLSRELGTSDDPQTWPLLDKFVPRSWHHGKKQEHPTAIQAMIDEFSDSQELA